ncbi:MAG: response regulator [Lewinellaceae bacterium]|nr:response regulator [Lewinellaceae bacterium]
MQQISPETLAEKLSQMDLFQSVPEEMLLNLASQSRIEKFYPDEAVFLKNDPGASLYLILKGTARVHDEDYTVAKLSTGQCFGEVALLDDSPRSMSISANEPLLVARIDRDVFFGVLGEHPNVMQRIVIQLASSLRRQTEQTLKHLRQREEELTILVEQRTAELQRQKEEADRQRLRAEQSERAEQQFLANMSHEIRTPMNAVTGLTNILLHKNPREDQLKYLHHIREAADSLLIILNDILDISKIQAGKLELERTDLHVAHIFEQVRSLLSFQTEEKGLVLNIHCDPRIPETLNGDPVRLKQIVLNLTSNAVRFTEKGHVGMKAELLEMHGQSCRIHFEVEDSGIGMSEEQLQFVFENFRQATSSTTRKYGGTGLGLSISNELVRLFGGTLKVASKPGEGSRFWFDIAFEPGATGSVEAPQNAIDPHQSLRGLRILLAEDNLLNQMVAEEMLQLLLPEVTIVTALNGKEAVDLARDQTFDVILMDVTMPEMDGLEATTLIRQLPQPKCQTPVIAFTASVTTKEVQRCLQHGMNGCIPKPFKEEEMINALYAALYPEPSQPVAPSPFIEELAGGNPERIQRYLNLYIDSAQMGITRLQKALPGNDREEIRKVVHTLKPNFRMFGLEDLAQQAETIEKAILDRQDEEGVPLLVEVLLEGLRESVNKMSK